MTALALDQRRVLLGLGKDNARAISRQRKPWSSVLYKTPPPIPSKDLELLRIRGRAEVRLGLQSRQTGLSEGEGDACTALYICKRGSMALEPPSYLPHDRAWVAKEEGHVYIMALAAAPL